MRKINAYNFITLNGFYKGLQGDISWHKHGAEENTFSEKSLEAENILLFGRVTYEMMAGFWPTPAAHQHSPVVAKEMNDAEKIVFSRTLNNADWNNTLLIKDNIFEEIRKMKALPGKDMTILGSGSIVTQFAEQQLLDSYQLMIDPVVIKNGTAIFNEINCDLNLKLVETRSFKSEVVLLSYTVEY